MAPTVITHRAGAGMGDPAARTRPALYWNERLTIVRGFARYLQASDPRTEVPPDDLLPAKKRRAVPYLYSEADDRGSSCSAARKIRPPLKAATIETIVGLLAVTGMRIGEAIALDRDDVELFEGRLTVRRDKSGKSREVALHPSTVSALVAYARVRDELCPHPKDPSFLISRCRGATAPRDRRGTSLTGFAATAGLTTTRSGAQPACMICATRSCCGRC